MNENEQIQEMAREICGLNTDKGCFCDGGYCNYNCLAYEKAKTLYAKDYRKVERGEWIFINQAVGCLEPPYGDTAKCSACEFIIDVSEMGYKFCPNCGADMRGKKE